VTQKKSKQKTFLCPGCGFKLTTETAKENEIPVCINMACTELMDRVD
jgi:hypothetical protein